jgi:hypothetical protein
VPNNQKKIREERKVSSPQKIPSPQSAKDFKRVPSTVFSDCWIGHDIKCHETFLEHQSGEEMSISFAPPVNKAANLQFVDEASAHMYAIDAAEDDTRLSEDTSDVELAEFFKRPVKIYETEWGTGTKLSDTFNPWELFFNNKRVMNRISNFNLLRSMLHVKVVLNGNGFQYGRTILAYNPLDLYDDFKPSTLLNQDIVQLSQLPHIYLNPTTSQGGELHLPFFYHLNSIKQPDSSYGELGECYLESINTLRHANGATDKVTISVFAWAERLTLAVPTSLDSATLIAQSGFEIQSGEIDEANTKGFISGPATTVASIAGSLSAVPVIGKYALATSMVAKTTASVAKSFGYCRPTVTKNPEPYRPFPVSSLSLTTVPDHAQKLTVDDKQELTIDTEISGIKSGDVLSLSSIASRESYLTTFDWNVGTAPDTLLWNSRVTPVTWAEIGSPRSYHFPPCAMASMPFKYWRGTMNYRFQVVSSNYHKGRLRIAYDPNFFDATPEYNINYMHIVDISEKNDFTVSVTNGQQVSLLDHANPGSDSATEIYSSTQYSGIAPGNGVLQVTVLNELTVPSDVTNDIEINVFVSAGDDFEAFVPDDHFQYFVFKPQMGFEPQSGMAMDATPYDSEPVHDEATPLNGTSPKPSSLNTVFTGESIGSFRTMMKRYNLHTGFSPVDTFHSVISMSSNSFPYLRGNVTGAVHTRSGGSSYNYCNTVLMHWVTYAFAGWRGSIRYKFLPRGGFTHMTTMIERSGIRQGTQYSFSVGVPEGATSFSNAASETVARIGTTPINDRPLAGKKGMVYAVSEINPCVEVEMPFYSQARFVPGRTQDWTGSAFNTRYNESFDYRSWVNSSEGDESFIDSYVATGEDFQVYFFKGLPRMYYEPTPPTSA